jgi:hypothetical protein
MSRMTWRRWGLPTTLAVVGLLALAACGGGETTGAKAPQTKPPAAQLLAIHADTVMGSANIPEGERVTKVCVLANRFPRNSEVVWRARVLDAAGAEMTDKELTSVQVNLAGGTTLDMRYGPHPKDNPVDFFWTVSFDIPPNYPTGTLNYTTKATAADRRTGTYEPFKVAPSLLTVTKEVLPTIKEG